MKPRVPYVMIVICIACLAALTLHAGLRGAGFGQFVALLVATPVLMTVAGLAYVVERRAVGVSRPAFRALMATFALALALAWGQLFLLTRM